MNPGSYLSLYPHNSEIQLLISSFFVWSKWPRMARVPGAHDRDIAALALTSASPSHHEAEASGLVRGCTGRTTVVPFYLCLKE